MRHETVFKIAFGTVAVLVLGAIGHAQRRAMRERGSRFAQAANEVPGLLWIRGALSVPAYAFLIDWLFSANWFPWATVGLPVWLRGVGVVLAGLVVALVWWTHLVLGSNYRGAMGLHPNHKLVTHGPYRYVRHPTYVAFPLLGVALFLLSANWVLGFLAVTVTTIVAVVRAPNEERELTDRFGGRYREYMRNTGRFLPRLRRRQPRR